MKRKKLERKWAQRKEKKDIKTERERKGKKKY